MRTLYGNTLFFYVSKSNVNDTDSTDHLPSLAAERLIQGTLRNNFIFGMVSYTGINAKRYVLVNEHQTKGDGDITRRNIPLNNARTFGPFRLYLLHDDMYSTTFFFDEYVECECVGY